MAFKFVAILCSLLAVSNAGFIGSPVVGVVHKVANPSQDAVAATHENVVRSFGGTVSTHSKAVDTPYSSVRKTDTRVSNNVYTPAIAKTVTYAAPAVAKTVSYAAPAYTTYSTGPAVVHKTYAAPAYTSYSAPAVTHYAAAPVAKTVTYAAPAVTHYSAPAVAKTVSYAAPAPVVYAHPQPVTKTVSYEAPAPAVYHQQEHHEVPVTTYNHGPAATTYTHNAPGVAAYGSSQTVHFSPAEMVSHMSFDGFGAHYGF